ncbi:MAG: magnesium chelatase subunit D [Pseudomonadota bacterium]
MTEAHAGGPQPWADAGLAAALFAIDPHGLGGVALRARHGPVREVWLAGLRAALPPDAPLRRLPPATEDARLLGGLDLVATLDRGRPVASRGLMAECDGGTLVLTMAERTGEGLAARLAAALDTGAVRSERDGLSQTSTARFGLVALDEGAEAEERPPEALLDRLAFRLDLDAVSRGEAVPLPYRCEDVLRARDALAAHAPPDEALEALTKTAAMLGIVSLRAPLLALRATAALSALLGPGITAGEATEIAARLVFAPRATRLPSAEPEADPDPPAEPPVPEHDAETQGEPTNAPLADRVLEAAEAAIPAGLLERLAAAGQRRRGEHGRAGAERDAFDRGRPLPSRPGPLNAGRRVDVVATLRAAAPWQALRQAHGGAASRAVRLRASDLRLRRYRRHSASATVFAVDASGSTAAARLAEAKGAVELLLAEAYVRRDLVALVAFRGTTAEVLLPPTGAPALARRRLAALPGGGGTPLALGLEAAAGLATKLSARGTDTQIVLLTDGRANIDRAGQPGRTAASDDALASARACRARGHGALVIDTGARPRPEAAALAEAMGARYLALPRADAGVISAAAVAARTQ